VEGVLLELTERVRGARGSFAGKGEELLSYIRLTSLLLLDC
jgi:hypothetical protein